MACCARCFNKFWLVCLLVFLEILVFLNPYLCWFARLWCCGCHVVVVVVVVVVAFPFLFLFVLCTALVEQLEEHFCFCLLGAFFFSFGVSACSQKLTCVMVKRKFRSEAWGGGNASVLSFPFIFFFCVCAFTCNLAFRFCLVGFFFYFFAEIRCVMQQKKKWIDDRCCAFV